MPYEPTTNFRDSDDVDLGKKLVTKDYLLEVYGTILESSGATGLVVTPELWVWGENASGRLGDGTATTRSTPVAIRGGETNWKQVSRGREHSAAIKTDGTLWMWGGDNILGLGVTTTTGLTAPYTTFAGGTDWKQVSCGRQNTAAIKTDGTLWVWGDNSYGQVGTSNNTNITTPVTTFAGGTDWKQVSCGTFNTAAIKTDGSLWIWGRNSYGQLGINNTSHRNTPVTTFAGGTTWKQVACIDFVTSAIKTDGTLWNWGYNANGQLGVNDTTNRNTPVTTFAGGNDWKQTSVGAAIKTDGSLWLWGAANNGRLGTNDVTPTRLTPVTTFAGGNNWKQVSGSSAIKTDGSLWTWGRNSYGELGINNTTDRSTPVTTFAGGTNWKQVSLAFRRSSAIQSNDYI